MADGMLQVSVQRGSEWDRVLAAVDEVSATLALKIREAASRAVDPWMKEAQAKVTMMPVRGRKHTGLRAEVARSVQKSEEGSAEHFSVTVTSSLPSGHGEENEGIIPLGMDRASGWSHPVYGHEHTWVSERSLRPGWFSGTFSNRNDDVTNQIQDALNSARDKIIAAGA